MKSIKTIVLPSVKKLLEEVYVVIPALNEEKRIGALVSQLEDKGFTNIIVVNDGSEDRTPQLFTCLLYTSPSPRDQRGSRMPSSA